VLVPLWSLHRHYDDAIADLTESSGTGASRRRPEQGADAMRAKDGRRFFLKNTAPNLAGGVAELARAAIEATAAASRPARTRGPRTTDAFARSR
jgi:hypothetical protein